MSVNPPPNPNISTFNNDYWNAKEETLTTAAADLRYLKFPLAQGAETFSSLTTVTPTVGNNTTTVPNTSWVNTAIANASNVLSSVLVGYNTPNYSFGSTFTVSGNSATQFADIYILGGGGNRSNDSPANFTGGGAGGAGGSVIYNRMPMGNVAISCRIEPKFVNNFASPGAIDAFVWTGLITQSGTNITLALTSSTSLVGSWIEILISTGTYNQFTYSQLYIISGSGVNWTCLSSQSQTITTPVTAKATFNNVSTNTLPYWTGTLSQSGNTLTILSTATGSANGIFTNNSYCIINSVSYTIQSIVANSGANSLTTNCSQTTGSVSAAIYGTPFGSNNWTNFVPVNIITSTITAQNNYTNFPSIGWVSGGVAGSSAGGGVGVGGIGGNAIATLGSYGFAINGSIGQGGASSAPSNTWGGQSILLTGRTTTINGTSTQLSTYNYGSNSHFNAGFVYTTDPSGSGAVAVVLYNS